jgi:hypothetical protein
MVEVDEFLESLRDARRQSRQTYKRQLAAAGVALGFPALGEVSLADLAGYAASLAAEKGSTLYALATLRSFLAWAGTSGRHRLDPAEIRAALRAARPAVETPSAGGARRSGAMPACPR